MCGGDGFRMRAVVFLFSCLFGPGCSVSAARRARAEPGDNFNLTSSTSPTSPTSPTSTTSSTSITPSTSSTPNNIFLFMDTILYNYDKRVWPTYGKNYSTEVRINIHINSIGPVDAANMEFGVDMYLRQSWRDPRLEFRSFSDQSVTINGADVEIWLPDLFFRNVKRAFFHTVTVPNKLIIWSPDGDILYSLRLTLKLGCRMYFKRYPLDTQHCSILLGPYSQTADQVSVDWKKGAAITKEGALELPAFKVIDQQTSSFMRIVDTGNFTFVNVTFVLERLNGYHVLQTYLPTFIIVMISWVSFWLDVNATPARVTLGVTTLLTLSTVSYGAQGLVPPVSYVKAVDVWLGVCCLMVFAALLEFTLINYSARSKRGLDSVADWINFFHWSKKIDMASVADGERSDTEANFNLKKAKSVDRFCRVCFPLTFFLFNLVYWLYYLYVPDDQLN